MDLSSFDQVVILGDGGVGKSCLMNRFVTDRFDEHSFHTIGVEFLNKEIELGGETYTLQACCLKNFNSFAFFI